MRRISGLPHARGGVSIKLPGDVRSLASSPRPWGCFAATIGTRCAGAVFPTPVGVFLFFLTAALLFRSLPHARGGVSP